MDELSQDVVRALESEIRELEFEAAFFDEVSEISYGANGPRLSGREKAKQLRVRIGEFQILIKRIVESS